MRWLALLFLLPLPAMAETWTGAAHVVDGDTVYVDQTRLRLLSMDAFETAQNCQRDGKNYACGLEATLALIGLIRDRPVTCVGEKRDRYGRPLVVCRIGEAGKWSGRGGPCPSTIPNIGQIRIALRRPV